MNFIQYFLQTLNPHITVEHRATTEETGQGVINHEFVCFTAEDVNLNGTFAARIFSKRLGQKVFPFLNNLLKKNKEQKQRAKIAKTKAWVHKKAVWHPALVEECTHKLLKKMRQDPVLQSMPIPYAEIYKDTSIIAILHDIGRLSEVDIINGAVCMKRSGLNKNHAAISFDILEHSRIKPEILLAIKYHEFADVAEAVTDKLYIDLPEQNKTLSEFYIRILQDMDKTANLTERAKFGIKKCAEFYDPHYIQDYDMTEDYFQQAITGNYLNIKGGHLLDAMMRFVTWTYSIHFKQTKEILSAVLTDFFWQMYQETWREYENATAQNPARLALTLAKIIQLEDYAIAERLQMPINQQNRQKIVAQIAKLQNT